MNEKDIKALECCLKELADIRLNLRKMRFDLYEKPPFAEGSKKTVEAHGTETTNFNYLALDEALGAVAEEWLMWECLFEGVASK